MNTTKLTTVALLAALALSPVAVTTPVFAQFLAAPPPVNVPGGPSNYPRHADTYDCSDQLGYLRRVYTSELDAVRDYTQVWVTPICAGDHVFRSEGNAGALRGAIADNEAMLIALGEQAFRPEDVVGVRMTGEDKVTLYVSPFHR